MSLLVPRRVEVEELLDDPSVGIDDRLRSLRDLRRFNSLAGGRRAYAKFFRALTRDATPPLTVLDIGSGTSDLVSSLGPGIRKIALDWHLGHLAYGRQLRRDDVGRVAGDALELPFRDGSVDLVTSSHFFHHFRAEENVRIIGEALRVARIGAMFTDTRRHLFPWLFVKALGWLKLVGRVTRFDAPASVLQGYTASEAAAVAARSAAAEFEMRRSFPFRFGLLLWKSR
ncbi:MAG: class I SAM-dependent methyltransferase [Thermoanaerobaculia bacterium]